MASARSIKAGSAYLEFFLDDGKLQRGLKTAERRISRFGSSLRSNGAALLGFGGALAAPFVAGIKAASDMQETMNKFNVVFGENAASVKAWGDNFASEVGRSKKEVAEFLASSQDLLVPIGFEAGEAEGISKQLTSLAVDLASFNNMSDASVMNDLQAALTGSGEVMKKYGVIVSEAAVKQQLLNSAIDPKAATEQQKAMARLEIIMTGTTAAHGDAERSAAAFANQMKRLQARVMDTAVSIGSALLPAVTPLIQRITSVVQIGADWISANNGAVLTIAKLTAGVVGAGAVLVTLGTAVQAVAFGVGGLTTAIAVSTKVIALMKTMSIAAGTAMTTTIVPNIIAYTSVVGAASIATTAFKVALGGGIVLAAGAAAVAIYKADSGVRSYNQALKEMNRLTGVATERFSRLQDKTLKAAARLDGDQKESFLADQLERAKKELAGAEAQLKGQKRTVAGLNTFGNSITGNKILASEKVVLQEKVDRVGSLKTFVERLEDAFADTEAANVKRREFEKTLATPVVAEPTQKHQAAPPAENLESMLGKILADSGSITIDEESLRLASDAAFGIGFAGTGGLGGATGLLTQDPELVASIEDFRVNLETANYQALSASDIRSSEAQAEIYKALLRPAVVVTPEQESAAGIKKLVAETQDTNKLLKGAAVLKGAKT